MKIESTIEAFDEISMLIKEGVESKKLLEHICDLAGAEGGTLWSNEDGALGPSFFVLRACVNRPNLKKLIGAAHFDIDDTKQPAHMAFNQKKVVHNDLGEFPFDEEWLGHKYAIDLKLTGVKYIAVVPIWNSENDPFRVISLYFRSIQNFQEDFLLALGRLAGSIHESVNVRYRKLRLERRMERHEVLRHRSTVENKAKYIFDEAMKHIDSDEVRYQIQARYDALRSSLEIIKHAGDRSTFKERVRDRFNDRYDLILSDTLFDIAHGAVTDLKKKNSVTIGNINGPQDLEVSFNTNDFSILFSNLYENAAKYAFPGSAVITYIRPIKNFIRVEIRNEVHHSEDEDLVRLLDYEYRGNIARESDVSGDGIGLGIVSDICDVYDMKLKIAYEHSKKRVHTKVFCVSLDFL